MQPHSTARSPAASPPPSTGAGGAPPGTPPPPWVRCGRGQPPTPTAGHLAPDGAPRPRHRHPQQRAQGTHRISGPLPTSLGRAPCSGRPGPSPCSGGPPRYVPSVGLREARYVPLLGLRGLRVAHRAATRRRQTAATFPCSVCGRQSTGAGDPPHRRIPRHPSRTCPLLGPSRALRQTVDLQSSDSRGPPRAHPLLGSARSLS